MIQIQYYNIKVQLDNNYQQPNRLRCIAFNFNLNLKLNIKGESRFIALFHTSIQIFSSVT